MIVLVEWLCFLFCCCYCGGSLSGKERERMRLRGEEEGRAIFSFVEGREKEEKRTFSLYYSSSARFLFSIALLLRSCYIYRLAREKIERSISGDTKTSLHLSLDSSILLLDSQSQLEWRAPPRSRPCAAGWSSWRCFGCCQVRLAEWRESQQKRERERKRGNQNKRCQSNAHFRSPRPPLKKLLSLPRLLPPAEAPVQPLRPLPAPRQRPHGAPLRGMDSDDVRLVLGLCEGPEGQAGLCRDALLVWCRSGVLRFRGAGFRDCLSAFRGEPGHDRRDFFGLDGSRVELRGTRLRSEELEVVLEATGSGRGEEEAGAEEGSEAASGGSSRRRRRISRPSRSRRSIEFSS